jgi:hypothetical protein
MRSRTKGPPIPEETQQPDWELQPDGSRVRVTDGIRIVDRTSQPAAVDDPLAAVEHLVTWQEDAGRVVVLGLDAGCRPLSLATLYAYL